MQPLCLGPNDSSSGSSLGILLDHTHQFLVLPFLGFRPTLTVLQGDIGSVVLCHAAAYHVCHAALEQGDELRLLGKAGPAKKGEHLQAFLQECGDASSEGDLTGARHFSTFLAFIISQAAIQGCLLERVA